MLRTTHQRDTFSLFHSASRQHHLGFDPSRGHSLKSWTWFFSVPSNSEYYVISGCDFLPSHLRSQSIDAADSVGGTCHSCSMVYSFTAPYSSLAKGFWNHWWPSCLHPWAWETGLDCLPLLQEDCPLVLSVFRPRKSTLDWLGLG